MRLEAMSQTCLGWKDQQECRDHGTGRDRERVCGRSAYTNEFVLRSGGEVSTVRTEADRSDIQVALLIGLVVLENADLLAGLDVEDLGGPVAAGGDELAVVAEADAADDAAVVEGVQEVDVQHAAGHGVEDGVPVVADALERRRQLLQLVLGQLIADALDLVDGVSGGGDGGALPLGLGLGGGEVAHVGGRRGTNCIG